MKKGTLWAIGIATAIITTISLNAAIGSRYRMHRGHFNHACWQDQKNGKQVIGEDSSHGVSTRR